MQRNFTNKMLVQKPGEPLQFTFLDNYIKLFTNDLAHQAFMNTLLYAVMVVPTTIRVKGIMATIRMMKGTDRPMLTIQPKI